MFSTSSSFSGANLLYTSRSSATVSDLICAAESTGDAGAALGTPWAGGVGGGFGRGGAKLGGGFGRFDPLRPNGGGRIDAGGAKLGGGGRPTGTEVTAAMPPMLVIDGTPPPCAIANTEPRITEFAPLLYFVESERGNSFVCLGDGIFSDGRIKGIEDPDPGGGGPVGGGGGGAPGGGGDGALIPTSSRGWSSWLLDLERYEYESMTE